MGSLERAIHKLQQNAAKRPSTAPSSHGKAASVARADAGEAGRRPLLFMPHERLVAGGLAPPREQEKLLTEQFRALKRPLIANAFSAGGVAATRANLVMVTSAVAGEGKSFNCFNLALSMAQEKDRPVTLIDADVVKPHLSAALGAGGEPGLLDVLADESLTLTDVIMPTDIDGLSFLPCGTRGSAAHELLASQRMEALFTAFSTSYHGMVIFDSPPLLPTNEARVLAALVGQVLLVVGASSTPQAQVLEAVGLIEEEKSLNLVLNRATSGAGEYSYTYGRS